MVILRYLRISGKKQRLKCFLSLLSSLKKKFTYQIESYKGIPWISPPKYTILIF